MAPIDAWEATMANKNLLQTILSAFTRAHPAEVPAAELPPTDAVNEAGGAAYTFGPKHALAQLALTGTLHHTFYASAETQMAAVMEAALAVDPQYLARAAIYAREHGYMKDLPAMLTAVLVEVDGPLGEAVFPRVIDNGKMLRTYVQLVRSGALGRKSLGARPKRLVRQWLAARTGDELFRASVGNDPSLADVVKMVHPKPKTEEHSAFFAWLINKPHDASKLPPLLQAFEAYKANPTGEVPAVPFEMLTALPLGAREWTEIAKAAPWQMTRMNLNTFRRHGVFDAPKMVQLIADRLRDERQIRKARAFPYQLLMAARAGVHEPALRKALEDALEIATTNVPELQGRVAIAVDVSGSMQSPVTGHRPGATTAVRCVDVAGLVGASLLRKNPTAIVLPFEHRVVPVDLSARASVQANTDALAAVGGGGTDCAAPLCWLAERREKVDLVWMISDNESWVQSGKVRHATTMMQYWDQIKQVNPNAKLVLLDIQPYTTSQAPDRPDILNIGGFSDRVFEVVADFVSGRSDARHLVDVIERVTI